MPKYKLQDFEKALVRRKGLVFVAARDLGCSPQTFHTWLKKHPTLREIRDSEKGQLGDFAEAKIINAMSRDPFDAIALDATKFFLRTQHKDRGYVERQETTGKDGKPIQYQDMTPSERRSRIAEIEKRLGISGVLRIPGTQDA